MSSKQDLIEEILALEFEMFSAVQASNSAPCQQNPQGFRTYRNAQFRVWSVQTLCCYLADLRTARKSGVNLMTLKYARMEGLIAGSAPSPLIEEIVRVQYAWQQQLFRKYPKMAAASRTLSSQDDNEYRTSFETYLSGELSTYSAATLESLYSDMQRMQQQGINMSEQIYAIMARS